MIWVQRDDWFRRWQTRVATWQLGSVGRLAMVILPPLVVAQLLLSAVQSRLFGALLWIVLAVIMLLYALGRGDFQQRMARYRSQCRAADFEGAYLDTLSDAGVTGASGRCRNRRKRYMPWCNAVSFTRGISAGFPPCFILSCSGPVGALAYRLLQLCRDNVAAGTCRALYCAGRLGAGPPAGRHVSA